MRVVSYLNVIPAKNKSQEKTDILHNFVEGVRIKNDEGLIQHEPRIVDCDVAVIHPSIGSAQLMRSPSFI